MSQGARSQKTEECVSKCSRICELVRIHESPSCLLGDSECFADL